MSNSSQHDGDDGASEIAKMVGRLEVYLKLQVSDSFDTVSVDGSVPALKMACYTNRIHEGTEM